MHPGITLTGKIALLDKKAIPASPPGCMWPLIPESRIDNRVAAIAPDGTFVFDTVAPRIYSLSVSLTGYAPTSDTRKEVLIERDRGDVIIRMAQSRARE